MAAQVRSQIPAIKRCYEDQLVANPGLTAKAVARWTIDLTGAATAVAVDSTEPAVGACIAELIKTWRFRAPTGRSVEVSFPFIFKPSPSDEKPPGPPNQADITSVIRDNRADIKQCYQQALAEDRTLIHGRITVTVAIDTSGQARHVEIQGPPEFQVLEPCIKQRIWLWSFPRAPERYGTEFVYVFEGNQ